MQLRRGVPLHLTVEGQALILLYLRNGPRRSVAPDVALAREKNLVKARLALRRKWRSPEGRKQMLAAAKRGAGTRAALKEAKRAS